MAQRDKDDKLITSPSTRLRVFHSLWAAAAIAAAAHLAGQPGGPKATDVTILINEVTPAPEWAVVQREMLEAAGASARLWVDRYVRPDGSVNVPERWGVTDGPDDIMETVRGWPLAHAMGAPDSVADAFEKVWVSHIHIRYLSPFPRNLGDLLGRFDRILVPEMNNGQLVTLLRAAFLLPAERFCQVNGKPFKVSTIHEAILARTSGNGKRGAA
jgi:hypothetical protein